MNPTCSLSICDFIDQDDQFLPSSSARLGRPKESSSRSNHDKLPVDVGLLSCAFQQPCLLPPVDCKSLTCLTLRTLLMIFACSEKTPRRSSVTASPPSPGPALRHTTPPFNISDGSCDSREGGVQGLAESVHTAWLGLCLFEYRTSSGCGTPTRSRCWIGGRGHAGLEEEDMEINMLEEMAEDNTEHTNTFQILFDRG